MAIKVVIMKKIITVLVSFFLCFFSIQVVYARGAKETSQVVRIVAPNGGPGIAISKLAADTAMIGKTSITYEVVDGADLLQSKILSNEADLAIVPTNLASILYAKTADITYLATVVWGNLYCISTDSNIKTMQDIKGKTIYSFGRGLTPDITVREVFTKNGIDIEKDVKIEYLPSVQDIASVILSGKANIAIIAEPVLSQILTKKSDAHIICNIQEEWKHLFGESYPQAGLIVRNSFLKQNSQFIKTFLEKLKSSITWINDNPAQAAEYASKIMNLPPVPVVQKAIPGLTISFASARESKQALEKYFTVLSQTDIKFIGGKLPAEDFYY